MQTPFSINNTITISEGTKTISIILELQKSNIDTVKVSQGGWVAFLPTNKLYILEVFHSDMLPDGSYVDEEVMEYIVNLSYGDLYHGFKMLRAGFEILNDADEVFQHIVKRLGCGLDTVSQYLDKECLTRKFSQKYDELVSGRFIYMEYFRDYTGF